MSTKKILDKKAIVIASSGFHDNHHVFAFLNMVRQRQKNCNFCALYSVPPQLNFEDGNFPHCLKARGELKTSEGPAILLSAWTEVSLSRYNEA